MRILIDWLIYAALWAMAISLIAALYKLTLHDWPAGVLGFAAYFVGAHFLFKWLGYRRGIFDVP